MTNEYKELCIRALHNMRGDDLERARMAFRNFTPKQMQEQHFQSGKTRQEILDQYEAFAKRVDDAINWLQKV